jgi:hypothetical protein
MHPQWLGWSPRIMAVELGLALRYGISSKMSVSQFGSLGIEGGLHITQAG